MASVSNLKTAINELRFNPVAIQRKMLELLEQTYQGEIDVVDPSNPFVFVMEMGAVGAASAMIEAEALTRQQYPSMAVTEEELYLHMSDKDYIGRFASPSRTSFTVLLHKEELFARAIETGIAGMRKIVIPRHTEFKVSSYSFTMLYPIEVRVMSYGGIQVVYDVSKPTPLQTVETNLVNWDIVRLQGQDFVRIVIPVQQLTITSQSAQVALSTGYTRTFQFNDQYYYTRAFRKTQAGGWSEIRTTHTEQVFDPTKPTLFLRVLGNRIQISVPPIYVTNQTLVGELRIDLYTTKGALDLILDNYNADAFSATWKDLEKDDNGLYHQPLIIFNTKAVYSDAIVGGGSNGLTFDELRERVIFNAIGGVNLPITNVQLISQLSNMGYIAVKDVDNITNRIYLATRQLPAPSAGTVTNPIGSLLKPLQNTLSAYTTFTGVIDNGDRVTLTSDILYQLSNGVVSIVPNHVRQQLANLDGDLLLAQVNNGNFLYSPFHYVLDTTAPYFHARCYYLDNPKIAYRQFLQENDSLGVQITTDQITVTKLDNGYRLRVLVTTGDIIKLLPDEDVLVILSFRPFEERRDVFLVGELVGLVEEERLYEFMLHTDFDIDAQHKVVLDNFTMFPDDVRPYRTDLIGDFNLLYYIKGITGGDVESVINYEIAEFLVGTEFIGVTHEKVGVKFGSYLDGFWNNSRSVIGTNTYVTYEEDVPAYYEHNVYERDETGTIVISLDPDTGSVVYNLLHAAGDPILDEEDNQVILHAAGDVVLDHDGNPTIANNRDIIREFDIFLLDGKYAFTNTEADLAYKREIPQTIVGWLENDIENFRLWALEQTEIYLYPQKTYGTVEVTIKDNEQRVIDLEQSFVVNFYLSRDKINNTFTKESLTSIAIQVISEELTKTRVTTKDIISKMTARVGDDAIGIELSGLGNELKLPVITLNSDTERLSVKKKLTLNLDGSFKVIDDVVVNFVRHEG